MYVTLSSKVIGGGHMSGEKDLDKPIENLFGQLWSKCGKYRVSQDQDNPNTVPLWFAKIVEGHRIRTGRNRGIFLLDTPAGSFLVMSVDDLAGEEMLGLMECFGARMDLEAETEEEADTEEDDD
jgi:hypothetical protein